MLADCGVGPWIDACLLAYHVWVGSHSSRARYLMALRLSLPLATHAGAAWGEPPYGSRRVGILLVCVRLRGLACRRDTLLLL